jgi:hypothetical protein
VNRSYGTPPANRPLDQWTEQELRDLVKDHFERHAAEDAQMGGSK